MYRNVTEELDPDGCFSTSQQSSADHVPAQTPVTAYKDTVDCICQLKVLKELLPSIRMSLIL